MARHLSQPPISTREGDRERAAALALLGQLQQAIECHDRAGLVDIARQLIAMRAPLAGQWQALAQLLADNGEVTLAREAIDLFVESYSGQDATRHHAEYQKAGLLAHLGAWDEASALLREVPADVPDPATHAYSSGTAALYLGQSEQARELLERSTALQPQSGSAWLSLATLVSFADEPELLERICASEGAMDRAPPRERAIYHYALGKAYADCAEHALAFGAFARGAGEMHSMLPYRRQNDALMAGDAVSGYDAAKIAAIASQQDENTSRSIFVTGLPRSGTTLVEQILTSHSEVCDGAEINRLSLLVKDIGGLEYAALERHIGKVGPHPSARLWQHWLDERFPGPGRVVDKTTNSTRLLGLAATLLPDAPLIWLRRDPLDCAWSCFRTYFANSQPWSNDLADIAFHFRLEDQLLRQWQDILGERLLVVPYEDLVSGSEEWIARILAHCGLQPERQAFAPHENRRAVTTSSVMQVRNPINSRSIGAAAPYEEFLAPFITAY